MPAYNPGDPIAPGPPPTPPTLLSTCLRYPEASERTFRSDSEWQAAHREFGQGPAPRVDFSRSTVAGLFDGPGSACTTFSIEGVVYGDEERGSLIHAVRHVFAGPCIMAIGYPQLVVSLERRYGPARFQVREVGAETSGPARPCL